MLQGVRRIFTVRAMRRRIRAERASIEAWSLHMGRDAAELWVKALAARDAARLSKA